MGADRDDRLDGDDRALGEQVGRGSVVVVGDVARLFVDRSADAVAAELVEHAEALPLDLALDGAADLANRMAGAGGTHAFLQRGRGAGGELLLTRRHRANAHGHRGVGDEAVELGSNVQLDQIAVLQRARTRNPVDGFVVHADAGDSGKVVDELGGRARAVSGQEGRGNGVELGGGDSGADGALHLAQGESDDAANPTQGFELLLGLDGHAVLPMVSPFHCTREGRE